MKVKLLRHDRGECRWAVVDGRTYCQVNRKGETRNVEGLAAATPPDWGGMGL
jgi:hypothetical protein